MDATHFDRLASRLAASRLSRRAALTAGSAGAAGLSAIALGAAGRSASLAQEATPEPSENGPAFLFVQLFEQGSWAAKPDEAGVYLLTLSGAGGQTLFFSDRPDLIVGTVPTQVFLDALGFTPVEPPNAAVVVQTEEGERDVIVVELFDPVYNEDSAGGGVRITYEARVLDAYEGDGLVAWAEEQGDAELPEVFTNASLFIDDCPDIKSCTVIETVSIGPVNQLVGPIPGGPYGRCWNWKDFNCNPCQHDVAYYNDLCNNAYSECGGQCDVSCWAGICAN